MIKFIEFSEFLVHFPFKHLHTICEGGLKIVQDSEAGGIDKQFEVRRSLIESRYDYPIDVKIDLTILKNSMKKGKKESLVYYIKMLIKSNVIPENHERNRKLLDEPFSNDECMRCFLLGKILKKEKKFSEAGEYFDQSMGFNGSNAIYEYAEIVGKNHIECLDSEWSKEYYGLAIGLRSPLS